MFSLWIRIKSPIIQVMILRVMTRFVSGHVSLMRAHQRCKVQGQCLDWAQNSGLAWLGVVRAKNTGLIPAFFLETPFWSNLYYLLGGHGSTGIIHLLK